MTTSTAPRLLILGGDGMLGHKLVQVLGRQFVIAATFRHTTGAWRRYPIYQEGTRLIGGVDVANFDSVVRAVAETRPDVVINAAGIIRQVAAAGDPIPSITVNALFPHRLADLCAAAGVRLLHISTDCVFSGARGAYRETDAPDPVDLYGRTKLLGEVDRPGALTLRTSIIGRDFVRRAGLLEWFLGNRGGAVNGFADHIFSGFTTNALAGILATVIREHQHLSGLYHVAAPPINKANLLEQVRDALKLDITVHHINAGHCDRGLDPSRFRAATGMALPGWDAMLAELAADPTPYDDWRTAHGAA